MADPVRISALSDAPAEFAVAEWRPRSIVQAAGIPGVASRRSDVERSVQLEFPARNRSSSAGTRTALWVGPDRWFIVDEAHDDLVSTMEQSAQGTMAVTELSSARTVLRLSGSMARDVLAQGCAVDLHPEAFVVGTSVATGLARHAVVLHLRAPGPVFDVYVYRSFGRDLLDCLRVAASRPMHARR
jgi:sarcosine oxidase, subunit gamma